MFVVTVIPISRGAFKDRLSFFSKRLLDAGVVVEVPVRGKLTPALVVSSVDAREEKLSLRESEYALKKITARAERRILPSAAIRAIEESARHHALPVGVIFAHYIPSAILTATERIHPAREDDAITPVVSDILALQASREERVRMYRNVARESFARGQSVILVAPTIAEAETLFGELKRGIEEQVLLLSGATAKKASTTIWNRAIDDPEPLLIIVTPSYLMIPRSNVGVYIAEHEAGRSWRGIVRPHLDERVTLEALAKERGARLIYADFPLRVETHERLKLGTMDELSRLQITAQSSTEVRVFDVRKKTGQETAPHSNSKKKFSVFDEKVTVAIGEELSRGGRVFLYASRKGLAPLTVCNDCGTPVTDPSSETPMTLHKTEAGNVFLSYHSGAVVPANISCRSCGSWNLVSLGIGITRVIEEAERLFPGTPLYALTAETAPTHAKAKKIQKQFFDTPRAILAGTERALPYLNEPVELSVVASIDSMLSISAWRAHEYALGTLFTIQGRTSSRLLVQTRQPESEVMRAIASGNPTDFLRHELKEREQFGYPPFTTFIGLSWSGTEKAVEKHARAIQDALKGWDLVGPLPARGLARGRYISRAVIRLETGQWFDQRLFETLRSLPPDIAITVDPDEIV